jgi:CRP-like cAMP-binding protein
MARRAPNHLYEHLPAEDIARLEAAGTLRSFPAERVLFAEGRPARRVFLLTEGQLTMSVGQGEECCVVGEVGPGELVGLSALLTEGARHEVSVTTASACSGLVLEREALLRLSGTRTMQLLQRHAIDTLLGRMQRNNAAVAEAWRVEQAGEEPEDAPAGASSGLRSFITRLLGGVK